jgi:hypothetical protein
VTRRTAALPRVAAASPCLPRTALGRPSCHCICARHACALLACARRTHVCHGALDRPSRRGTFSVGERVAAIAVAKPHRRPTLVAPPLPFWHSVKHLSCAPFLLSGATHTPGHTSAATRSHRRSRNRCWMSLEEFRVQTRTFSRKPAWASAHESLLSPRVNQAGPRERERKVVFQTLETLGRTGPAHWATNTLGPTSAH